MFATRSAGVLLHPTSLPGGHGIGDLGPTARRWVTWCQRAGFTWWQMLPVGPVGEGWSPYSPQSAFAIEPMLISLDDLVADGLIARRDLRAVRTLSNDARVRFQTVARRKHDVLYQAWRNLKPTSALRRFKRDQSSWLESWCAFAAEQDGLEPAYHAAVQYIAQVQWDRLRTHARRAGVRLIGDLPIFVTLESADVVAAPELFRLDRSGRPTVVTGVPPDSFSPTGQRWGHPHYRWSAHRASGWQWWVDRVQRQLALSDAVRVDHFVGFHHLFEIPADHKTAEHGRWKRSPGQELLRALANAVGDLPFIAEDLGAVTPEVTALRTEFGLPGMRLLQHAFGGADSIDRPHHHPESCVVYPGTHDNDTTRGWWRDQSVATRRQVRAYAGEGPVEDLMIRLCASSPARTAVIPIADILGLGRGARMNRPGIARGNWAWRMTEWPDRARTRWLDALWRATARHPERAAP